MRSTQPCLLFCVALSGCAGRNCDRETDPDKRDWCYYTAATSIQGGGQQIDRITGALQNIQSPMVRSFATKKILASSPDQFTQDQAQMVCATLSDPQRSECDKNWSRPHLWSTQ